MKISLGMKITLWVVASSIALVAVGSLMPTQPPAPAAVETPAKIAATKAAQRTYYAAQGVVQLQARMRNPDSFQLVTVGDMANGSLCYEYRSQNGFGGMTVGRASIINGSLTLSEGAWKKSCGGKGGADITTPVQGMIEFARTGKVW